MPKLLLSVLLLLGLSQLAVAQTPGSGGPAPQAPAATEVPLDGGVGLLLAGGMAFGLKHLRHRSCARFTLTAMARGCVPHHRR